MTQLYQKLLNRFTLLVFSCTLKTPITIYLDEITCPSFRVRLRQDLFSIDTVTIHKRRRGNIKVVIYGHAARAIYAGIKSYSMLITRVPTANSRCSIVPHKNKMPRGTRIINAKQKSICENITPMNATVPHQTDVRLCCVVYYNTA